MLLAPAMAALPPRDLDQLSASATPDKPRWLRQVYDDDSVRDGRAGRRV